MMPAIRLVRHRRLARRHRHLEWLRCVLRRRPRGCGRGHPPCHRSHGVGVLPLHTGLPRWPDALVQVCSRRQHHRRCGQCPGDVARHQAGLQCGSGVPRRHQPHHHDVGRDHRSAYDVKVPALMRSALAGAKQALDPQGVMNPGVLIDPMGRSVGIAGATAR